MCRNHLVTLISLTNTKPKLPSVLLSLMLFPWWYFVFLFYLKILCHYPTEKFMIIYPLINNLLYIIKFFIGQYLRSWAEMQPSFSLRTPYPWSSSQVKPTYRSPPQAQFYRVMSVSPLIPVLLSDNYHCPLVAYASSVVQPPYPLYSLSTSWSFFLTD